MPKFCYGVRKGRQPGLYADWINCEAQVKKFKGADYQGFDSHQQAIDWLRAGNIGQTEFPLLDRPPSPVPVARARARASRPAKSRVSSSSVNGLPPTSPRAGRSSIHGRPCAQSSSYAAAYYGSVGPFYAVAKGWTPGIYRTWPECQAQTSGSSGARYKKFDTIAAALEFLAVYGEGGHFSQFKSERFKPDNTASFGEEWNRLSQSQGWERGSEQYRRERSVALRNELQTHYFAPQSRELPVVKEEQGQAAAAVESVPEFDEEEVRLQGFQAMCREVGKEPGNSVRDCELILKQTLVNIVDLIDARRQRRRPPVWDPCDLEAFKRYTLSPPGDKMIPAKEASKDPLLRCFLKDFRRRQDRCLNNYYGRCSSVNRMSLGGGGGSVVLANGAGIQGTNSGRGLANSTGPTGLEGGDGNMVVNRAQRSNEEDTRSVVEKVKVEKDDGGMDVNRAQRSEARGGVVVERSKAEKVNDRAEAKEAHDPRNEAGEVVERARVEENQGDAIRVVKAEEDGSNSVATRTRSRTGNTGVVAKTANSEKDDEPVVVKRKRGRPKKEEPSRDCGPEAKSEKDDELMVVKRKRGRPRKEDASKDCVPEAKSEKDNEPAMVKRKRGRPRKEDVSQDCGPEAKKIVHRWTPTNHIMLRWIQCNTGQTQS